jgi:hypothetical protein
LLFTLQAKFAACRLKLAQLQFIFGSGSGAHQVYQGPNEVTVSPSSQGSYTLSFKPPSIGIFRSTLILAIPATQEKNIYALEGEGVEPAALDRLVARCPARGVKQIRLNVPNHQDSPIEYQVYTDIGFAQGVDTIAVPAFGSEPYKLTLRPLLPGVYTGTVTFTNANGQYVWFTLEVNVTAATPQDTIHIVTDGVLRPPLSTSLLHMLLTFLVNLFTRNDPTNTLCLQLGVRRRSAYQFPIHWTKI